MTLKIDQRSGVPVYRQIIDQVLGGVAAGKLRPGDQLPTVRQLAVDLAINPNTVVRAYRELEIREVLGHPARHRDVSDGQEASRWMAWSASAASGSSVANFCREPEPRESSWRKLSAI